MNNPQAIVLHTLAFDGAADIHTVRAWHLEKGWRDVGYHYLIRRSGEVQAGRGELEVGAHAKDGGYNYKSIGIAFEGHGDNERWTVRQIHEALKLCKDLMDRYPIPPHAVIGHYETGAAKTCPGKLNDMGAFRSLLFDYLPEDGE